MHLHFDLVSGIAGDMSVAALLDLGVPLSVVEEALAVLPLRDFELEVREHVDVGMAITARKFSVLVDGAPADAPQAHNHDHDHDHGHSHDHGHDHSHADDDGHDHSHSHGGEGAWSTIREMLRSAPLRPRVREIALDIFERIAHAEARVHGIDVEHVAFHEVGAIDSIVDIVAVAACVAHLNPEKITCSPVPLGRGFTWSQHGRIPVPAPATLMILEGVPMVASGLEKELVTPTGAGIVAALVDEFVEIPPIAPEAIGHGAGTRRLPDRPNLVRAILGRPGAQPAEGPLIESHDRVIEANLDDMSGELCGHVTSMLLDHGALDVWWTPILMKKGRPAHKLSVLCDPDHQPTLIQTILTETTSLGVRITPVRRLKAHREVITVPTPYGEVLVKLGRMDGAVINAAPEYESARAVSIAAGVPLKAVLAAALAALD